MSAILTYPNRKPKVIKNVGWLLRNVYCIKSFDILIPSEETGFLESDVVLVARLHFGGAFTIGWADRKVCEEWLYRRAFKGLWATRPNGVSFALY